MLMRCMTPGCPNFAAPADVLCPVCRRQSNNCAVSVDFFPLDACDAYYPDPDLADDLSQIAGFLAGQSGADRETVTAHETVIRRQQERLDLRERIIRKLMHQRDEALDQASAEQARADGLQAQIEGLHRQITLLQAEIDQLYDLGSNGKRKAGLATLDTAPGDFSPEDLGYNVLWTRVDPDTGREVLWRWYRVNGAGG